MTLYRVEDAQVRDVASGRLLTELVGQQVQIVTRDTTSPVVILDETESPITDSMLTVSPVYTVPRFWIDIEDPSDLYLDWLDLVTGTHGYVEFEAVLRDAALAARDAATASAAAASASAVSAAAAAEAAQVEAEEQPITGKLTVSDTATLNLTMTGAGSISEPYELTGAVVGAAPETLALGGLSDVDTSGAADGDSLVFDGAGWVAEPARNPVTVSDTAPADPELHDIWFDIS